MEIVRYSFMVNDRPLCVWGIGSDFEHDVDHFLRSIDPKYFEHVAEMHSSQLEGEQRYYAATALRVAYSHALETLFALLAATIQAPLHPLAWMVKYTNDDLRKVVSKIQARQALPTCLSKTLTPVSWRKIAEFIFPVNSDEDLKQKIHASYAGLWTRFAKDYLAELFEPEYNSIKHGLRITMHGSHFWLGLEAEPGVPAPPDQMRYMGGSDFGTSFFEGERLHDKNNFRVMRRSQNWTPQKFVTALPIISNCISNIVFILKHINGLDTSGMSYEILLDDENFDAIWSHVPQGMTFSAMNTIIDPAWIKPLTRQEIELEYSQRNPSGGQVE